MERKETVKATGWAARWYRIQVLLGVKGTTPLQTKCAFPAFARHSCR